MRHELRANGPRNISTINEKRIRTSAGGNKHARTLQRIFFQINGREYHGSATTEPLNSLFVKPFYKRAGKICMHLNGWGSGWEESQELA